jgi:hypothetical protein
MLHRLAADAVLLLHAAFIVFAVLGALPALRWRWWPALHLPAAAWAFFVEATGRLCPLTTVENELRRRAGDQGYAGGFIEHYLWPLIYPDGLTRPTQWALALGVLLVNALIYGLVWRRRRQRRAAAGTTGW